jgi:hypothetical protein
MCVGVVVYFWYRTPPNLEPLGTPEEDVAFYGLLAAGAGVVTALLGVLKEFISYLREKSKT